MGKPFSSMLSARFSPITARPTRPDLRFSSFGHHALPYVAANGVLPSLRVDAVIGVGRGVLEDLEDVSISSAAPIALGDLVDAQRLPALFAEQRRAPCPAAPAPRAAAFLPASTPGWW